MNCVKEGERQRDGLVCARGIEKCEGGTDRWSVCG